MNNPDALGTNVEIRPPPPLLVKYPYTFDGTDSWVCASVFVLGLVEKLMLILMQDWNATAVKRPVKASVRSPSANNISDRLWITQT